MSRASCAQTPRTMNTAKATTITRAMMGSVVMMFSAQGLARQIVAAGVAVRFDEFDAFGFFHGSLLFEIRHAAERLLVPPDADEPGAPSGAKHERRTRSGAAAAAAAAVRAPRRRCGRR